MGDDYAWGFSDASKKFTTSFWRTELIVGSYDWLGLHASLHFNKLSEPSFDRRSIYSGLKSSPSESQNRPQEASKLGMKHVKNNNNSH